LAAANELKEANGSEPGLRIKINGDVDEESAYIFPKSNGGGDMNFSPT
jgi:hypothetical protein